MDEFYKDELKLIDTKALAIRLGKNVRTIQRWRKDGKLPIPVISGCRKCYWSELQLLHWLGHFKTNSDTPQDSN